jgi:osmotically-inducible protein OsmY
MLSVVLDRLRHVLDADPRIRCVGTPIALSLDPQGAVTLDGEVASVAAKRLALDRAARHADGLTVVDHLRVAPTQRFSDAQIRRRFLDMLVDEPMFANYEFESSAKAPLRRSASWMTPRLEFGVDDGIVTLRGWAGDLLHKRLAGVLAWWAPGSCDVVNLLAVELAARDDDGEIASAVRLILDKDPLISDTFDVDARDAVVTLSGVTTETEARDAAEADAWYVLGVREVVNTIEVHNR